MKPQKPRQQPKRQPRREPKQRRKPDVTPEERDEDFDTADMSIPKPHQLPGLVQPPMQLRANG